MKRLVLCFVMLMVVVPLFHGTSWGVIVDVSSLNFTFNYNTPGARANAMGGAFQAVADDATAAYANPAGLIILKKPEFSAEYKYSNVTTVTYDSPDGFEREFSDSVSGIGFASFSYPHKNANITIFRHELVNSDSTWTSHQGEGTAAVSEYFSKIKIITYGVAGAYKLSNTFSLGLTAGFNELDYQIHILSPPDSPTDSIKWGGDDQAENFTLSALWAPHELFTLGVVYRYGPKFKFMNTVTTNNPIGTTINYFEDTFKVPDVLGVGISSRPFEGLTLSLDCNYIWYSQFMKDNKFRSGDTVSTVSYGDSYASWVKMDDTYEIHIGAEYVFSFKNPVAVRAGYAYKPDHRAYWEGERPEPYESNGRRIMPHGDDEHVFSGGFGVVLGENVQIDFAYSHSNFNEDYIASFVYRF